MNKAGSILSLKNTENTIRENKINEKENKINENHLLGRKRTAICVKIFLFCFVS